MKRRILLALATVAGVFGIGLVTASCDGFAFSATTTNYCNAYGWDSTNCRVLKCSDWWAVTPRSVTCPF
jgi:hypothetical protein